MQKSICYVPKWGGAQKQDFATVLSILMFNGSVKPVAFHCQGPVLTSCWSPTFKDNDSLLQSQNVFFHDDKSKSEQTNSSDFEYLFQLLKQDSTIQ